jgi:hypothetical protein
VIVLDGSATPSRLDAPLETAQLIFVFTDR